MQDHHEWLSEFTFWWHEGNKILELPWYDIEVTCVLQWCLSWFSAPTVLNETMRKNRRLVDSYNEVLNEALGSVTLSHCRRTWPPRDCLFWRMSGESAKAWPRARTRLKKCWSVGNWEVVLRCPQLKTKPPEFVSARRQRFQHFALSSSVTVQQRPLTVLPTVELSRVSSVLRLCDSTTATLTSSPNSKSGSFANPCSTRNACIPSTSTAAGWWFVGPRPGQPGQLGQPGQPGPSRSGDVPGGGSPDGGGPGGGGWGRSGWRQSGWGQNSAFFFFPLPTLFLYNFQALSWKDGGLCAISSLKMFSQHTFGLSKFVF